MATFNINNNWLFLNEIDRLLQSEVVVRLSHSAIDKIDQCREYLDETMKDTSRVIYGVNTGFGSLCNTVIDNDDLSLLQANLMKSTCMGFH